MWWEGTKALTCVLCDKEIAQGESARTYVLGFYYPSAVPGVGPKRFIEGPAHKKCWKTQNKLEGL
jgi:hypothetical protein